jgi:adenylate kinase
VLNTPLRPDDPHPLAVRRPIRIGVMGRPGSGKGTQSVRLARVLGVPHVSTGDLLRAEIEAGTRMGMEVQSFVEAGHLVPDARVIAMLARRLERDDALHDGFVLDGFPRNISQAQALDDLLEPVTLDIVVELLVPESEASERLQSRLVCQECGRPGRSDRRSGLCEQCGAVLLRRTDDADDVVSRRFETFNEETLPLIEWLDRRNRLVTVDGNLPIADVTREMLAAVEAVLATRQNYND